MASPGADRSVGRAVGRGDCVGCQCRRLSVVISVLGRSVHLFLMLYEKNDSCTSPLAYVLINALLCEIGKNSIYRPIVRLDLVLVIQDGPKNRTCFSVDNSAMVSGRKMIRQKFQNAVKNKKKQICIVKHLNIFCLISINIRHPRNSAKFDCNTWI